MKDINNQETQEWLESMQALIDAEGTDRAYFILQKLITFTKGGISVIFPKY